MAALDEGQGHEEVLRHLDPASWLEATDVEHRYGKNLMIYYRYWHMYEKDIDGQDDFFAWLDHKRGKHVDLPWCRRKKLEASKVLYMTPEQAEWFQVDVEDGILWETSKKEKLNTMRWGFVRAWQAAMNVGSGVWIFVLSFDYKLYVAQKIPGRLHHSSFLAGRATRAAGNIVVQDGKLLAVAGTSGHYRPTPENVEKMKEWLSRKGVKMQDVTWFSRKFNIFSFLKSCCKKTTTAAQDSEHLAVASETAL